MTKLAKLKNLNQLRTASFPSPRGANLEDPEYGSEEQVPDSEDIGPVEVVASPSSNHDSQVVDKDMTNRPPVDEEKYFVSVRATLFGQ